MNITDNINSELGFVLKNYNICGNLLIFVKKRKIQEFSFVKFSFLKVS